MEKLVLIFAFILCNLAVYGQCHDLQAIEEIVLARNEYRSNQIDFPGIYQSYNIPQDYYQHSESLAIPLIFEQRFWFGGLDSMNNLKLSASIFLDGDFAAGPIISGTDSLKIKYCSFYNRVWQIRKTEIEILKYLISQDDLDIEDIPIDILEWPAKGNPYIENFAPNYEMAPFYDADSNDSYDPLNGDYPIALIENPNFIPYSFNFSVLNDVYVRGSDFAPNLGIEIHQLKYILNCSEESELDRSVLTRVKFIYKGETPLNNVRIGLWQDLSLGCIYNDYFGYKGDLNCNYLYNENGIDDDGCPDMADNPVPLENGAIKSTVFLNADIQSFIYMNNAGLGNPEPATTDPQVASEFYNYLLGRWRDGSPITIGGSGYNSGTDSTSFVFPDTPTNPEGWSMQTTNLPFGDHRTVTSFYDGNLMPGQIEIIDFADHVLYDTELKALEVFSIWPNRVENLKDQFNNIIEGREYCDDKIDVCNADCVWPGDVDGNGGVTGHDVVYEGLFIAQNYIGPKRKIVSLDWFPFFAENWDDEFLSINAKNADINGNGILNNHDLDYLIRNFGFQQDFFVYPKEPLINNGLNKLSTKFTKHHIDVSSANQLVDRQFLAQIVLGDSLFQIFDQIHGISYDIHVDTNLIGSFHSALVNFGSLFQINFNDFRGAPSQNFETNFTTNNVKFAHTNYDGTGMNQGGIIMQHRFLLRENATTRNPDGKDTILFTFYNVLAVNAQGEEIDIAAQYDTIFVFNLPIDSSIVSSVNEIEENLAAWNLYPNPAQDQLTIEYNAYTTGTYSIHSVDNKIMERGQITQEKVLTIDISHYYPGTYIFTFDDQKTRSDSKVFIKL